MVCFFSWIDSFLQNDLNMAKGMIRNRENNLMEILHARVQNLEWLPYSICCSLSGCWPSREAFASQDAALGVYLSRHFVPSRGAVWSLKPRYHPEPERLGQIYLRHRRKVYASNAPLRA